MAGLLRSLIAGLAMAFLASLHAQAQRVIYVKKNATGANNGTSWTDAYTSLQDALAIAQAGDEIWVATGIYYPDEGAGLTDNDRTLSFRMKSGVAIYGGFTGTETDRSQRDWKVHLTVLSGDLDQNDIDLDMDGLADSLNGNNAYHVVVSENINQTAILSGFIIQDGLSDEINLHDKGGGIYAKESNLIITDVIVTNNFAYNGGGIYIENSNATFEKISVFNNKSKWSGGGIYTKKGNIRLVQSNIYKNLASGGAGIYIDGDARLTEVTITENRAEAEGGGIVVFGNSELTKVSVTKNSAVYRGGGAIVIGGSKLINTNISDNSAIGGEGGGLYISSYTGAPEFKDITVLNNSSFNGGGVYITGGYAIWENATISYNSASSGGGMYIDYNSNLSLSNITFANNMADIGGGLYVLGNVTLINADIYKNSASLGGGLIIFSKSELENVNIFENTATGGGGGITIYGDPSLENVSIFKNLSQASGGGMIIHEGSPTLKNVVISDNNSTSYYGGGISITGGNPTLTNVTIKNNIATDGGGGVYISKYISDSNPTFYNVVIFANSANLGGGIFVDIGGNPRFTNVIIAHNSSDLGGGLYNKSDSELLWVNMSIIANTAHIGGGYYGENASNVIFKNNLFAGNINGDCVGIINSNSSHNLIQDSTNTCGLQKQNNNLLGQDARLVLLQHDTTMFYRIITDSPALDNGDESVCPQTDLRNIIRPIDGDNDRSAKCDIGAIEFRSIDLLHLPVPVTHLNPPNQYKLAIHQDDDKLLNINWIPSTDEDGDPLIYRWEFGDTSWQYVFRKVVTTDTTFLLPYQELLTLLDSLGVSFGEGIWLSHRVITWDSTTLIHGKKVEVKGVSNQLFIRLNNKPQKVLLKLPKDNKKVIVQFSGKDTLNVTWTQSRDVDGDSLIYRWELSLDTSFTQLLIDKEVKDTTIRLLPDELWMLLNSIGVSVGDSLESFHRVIVSDGWSEVSSSYKRIVLLHKNSPPTPPSILQPISGDTIHIAGDPSDTLQIIWESAHDPDNDPIYYIWELAHDSLFSQILQRRTVGLDTTIGLSYRELANLLDSLGIALGYQQSLYHRITAIDSNYVEGNGVLKTVGPAALLVLVRGQLIASDGSNPEHFTFYGHYPNPAYDRTVELLFDLPTASSLIVEIYDILGRLVHRSLPVRLEAGRMRRLQLILDDLAVGAYLYQVIVEQPGSKRRIFTGTLIRMR